MKGIVFTEFLDMVEDTYSARTADRILSSCDLPSGGVYTAVGTYDSAEMSVLVFALASEVGEPPESLLERFGQRLFTRFTQTYPGFFLAGQSLSDFLTKVDSVIHIEVHKLYPDAETPVIDVTVHSDGSLVVAYRSPRELPDLAEGLLRGAVDHFGEQRTIVREQVAGDPSITLFRVSEAAPRA